VSVIIGPPSNLRVKLGNEIPGCGLLVRLDDFSDALQKGMNVLGKLTEGWTDFALKDGNLH
jgi:hypothetical protein